MPSERRRRRWRASRRYYTDSSMRGKRGGRELVGRGSTYCAAVVCRLVDGGDERVISQPCRLFRKRDDTPSFTPLFLSFPLALSVPSIPYASSVGAIDSAAGCISTVQGWRYEPVCPYVRYRVATRSNGFDNVYFFRKIYRAEKYICLSVYNAQNHSSI